MIFKHSYFIIIFIIFNYSNAQKIIVKDKNTLLPIENVVFLAKNTSSPLVSNALGEIEGTALKNASEIKISSLGYESLTVNYQFLEKNNFSIFLTPSIISMTEVVVSASKTVQETADIPAKIVTVNEQKISFYQPQTAADLLTISGKVFMQKSQQAGGSPMIRGFATNRLLYSVDGVRMNTAIFRGGNIQNVISLDAFATEKVEVLFGPSSVMYGSDAIGGVMNFQTTVPHFSTTETVQISGKAISRYSSANNEKTGHFNIQMGWKKWAMSTSFSANDFGDLRMGSHGPVDYLRPFYVQRQNGVDVVITNDNPLVQKPSAYAQINFTEKIRFKPNENWEFNYGLHVSETSSYSRYDRHIRYTNAGLPRYGEFSYGPQKWIMNNLSATHKNTSNLYDEVTFRIAHQYFEESRLSRNINNPNRQIRTEKVNALSFNADFNKEFTKKNLLVYGVEYITNDVNSQGIDENIVTQTQATGPSRYPLATWQSIGVYANDTYKASEKTSFQAGIRYNHFQIDAAFDTTFYPFPFTEASQANGSLTGSFGAVFRPNSNWVISSTLATAFRAPNVDDMGKVFDSEPGSVVVPNPNLRAEYAYSFDVNIAKRFGKHIKMDVSTYYTLLDHALVRRDFTLNGSSQLVYDGEWSQVQAVQNAANAYVYGIQWGMDIALPSGFQWGANLNYQKGVEELDNGEKSPSRHAAPCFGSARMGYGIDKVLFELQLQFSDEVAYKDLAEEERGKTEIYSKDKEGNPYAPSWYALHLKTQYKISEVWTLTSGIENITDQRYRPYSSGIVAPGRNFVLAVQAKW